MMKIERHLKTTFEQQLNLGKAIVILGAVVGVEHGFLFLPHQQRIAAQVVLI